MYDQRRETSDPEGWKIDLKFKLVCIRQRRSGLKVFGKEMRRVVGVKSKRRGW